MGVRHQIKYENLPLYQDDRVTVLLVLTSDRLLYQDDGVTVLETRKVTTPTLIGFPCSIANIGIGQRIVSAKDLFQSAIADA